MPPAGELQNDRHYRLAPGFCRPNLERRPQMECRKLFHHRKCCGCVLPSFDTKFSLILTLTLDFNHFKAIVHGLQPRFIRAGQGQQTLPRQRLKRPRSIFCLSPCQTVSFLLSLRCAEMPLTGFCEFQPDSGVSAAFHSTPRRPGSRPLPACSGLSLPFRSSPLKRRRQAFPATMPSGRTKF